MTQHCCRTGRKSNSFTRGFARATTSLLPGVVLVFLPKCPLCVAAWLTIATGITISGAVAAWLHASLLLLSFAALAITITGTISQRGRRWVGLVVGWRIREANKRQLLRS